MVVSSPLVGFFNFIYEGTLLISKLKTFFPSISKTNTSITDTKLLSSALLNWINKFLWSNILLVKFIEII